jgi:hypothetical protein
MDAAEQLRLRREQRKAKILKGAGDRLAKITGTTSGYQAGNGRTELTLRCFSGRFDRIFRCDSGLYSNSKTHVRHITPISFGG